MATKQQAKLLDFIKKYMEGSEVSPTHDEMMKAMNLKSKSGVNRILNGLEVQGLIVRLRNRSRTIKIVEDERRHMVEMVMQRILDERERCAKMAERYSELAAAAIRKLD